MNSLSFMILIIGILENLSKIFAAATFFGFLSIIICLGIMFCVFMEKGTLKHIPNVISTFKWSIGLLILTGFLSIFIIDKNYIVMIAASEVGEMALETENGKQLTGLSGDAIELLRTYIESEKNNLKAEIAKKAKEIE